MSWLVPKKDIEAKGWKWHVDIHKVMKQNNIKAYCILLCFPYCTLQIWQVFYKWMACGNPASGKAMGSIFPSTFALFGSLCHILVILAMFQTFSFLFVMVICDQGSLILLLWLFWGAWKYAHIRERIWLINVCVLTASPNCHSPFLFISLGLHVPQTTTALKLNQLNL